VSLHLERAQRSWEFAETLEKNRQLCDPTQHMTTEIAKHFFCRMSEKTFCWWPLDHDEVGGSIPQKKYRSSSRTSLGPKKALEIF
jgi:hypothetical protein